jgi:hypothetical protein
LITTPRKVGNEFWIALRCLICSKCLLLQFLIFTMHLMQCCLIKFCTSSLPVAKMDSYARHQFLCTEVTQVTLWEARLRWIFESDASKCRHFSKAFHSHFSVFIFRRNVFSVDKILNSSRDKCRIQKFKSLVYLNLFFVRSLFYFSNFLWCLILHYEVYLTNSVIFAVYHQSFCASWPGVFIKTCS